MNDLDALRESVRGLLSKQTDGVWQRLCQEIGVAGLMIPEDQGGAGAGLAEACVVQEELGRTLTGTPMLSTILATKALLPTRSGLLPAIAAGERTAALVWGDYVLDGDIADVFLVPRDGELYQVEPADATITPLPAMDASRRLARVEPHVTGVHLGSFDEEAIRATACVALAAEQVGAAARALELTVDYAKTRVQFGRTIGSFQALQHRMADLFVLVETARSAYLAAVDGDSTAAAVARVHCSETFLKVAAEMIQIHGGIGITWEHDAHRFFKKAHGSAELFGHPRTYVAKLRAQIQSV